MIKLVIDSHTGRNIVFYIKIFILKIKYIKVKLKFTKSTITVYNRMVENCI